MKKLLVMGFVALTMMIASCTGNKNVESNDSTLGVAVDSVEVVTDSLTVDSVAVDSVVVDSVVVE